MTPLKQAQGQLKLLYLLGSVYYTDNGHYPKNHFKNLSVEKASVEKALDTFQKNLWHVETKIIDRNRKGFDYNYLLPSKIPQSINI